jgi:hypothetical protein
MAQGPIKFKPWFKTYNPGVGPRFRVSRQKLFFYSRDRAPSLLANFIPRVVKQSTAHIRIRRRPLGHFFLLSSLA